MKPITLDQGADLIIRVDHDDLDLPSASEVKVYIDTSPQIIKSIGNGVSAITADSFILTISGEDTADIAPGEYDIQGRVTNGGRPYHARFGGGSTVKVRKTIY